MDLSKIKAYTQTKWGDEKCQVYLSDLKQTIQKIAAYPEFGTSRDDLSLGLRATISAKHQIFYRISANQVTILRVLHKNMDSSKSFQKKS